MPEDRFDAVMALEEMLGRGVDRLNDEDVAGLEARLDEHARTGVIGVVRRIRSGDAPPTALVEAFEAVRKQEIAHLSPPRIAAGTHRAELVKQLDAINLDAGGEVRARGRRGSASLLERLSSMPSFVAEGVVGRSADVALLWCLVRAGRIAERRAAVRRLGHLIVEGGLGDDAIDERELLAGLSAIRDPRIALEVDTALAAVQGSAGRAARQRLARVDRLLIKLRDAIGRFWAGDRSTDPLVDLSREESLRLGVWLRRGKDDLAAHMAEHLRLLLSRGDEGPLADAVGALIPSSDERLVPALCRVLADGPLSARIATARALGRIADPRVRPALVKAYRHATDVTEKTVLGGALGQYGDRRALAFLLEQLDDDESALWEETVRSLGSIGAEEAAAKLLPLIGSERSTLVRAAARALIRCGRVEDLRALRAGAAKRSQHAGVIADAAEALALRLQLLGTLPEDDAVAALPIARASDEPRATEIERVEPSIGQRLRSVGHYALGLLWSALWQRARALSAFRTAAEINPRAASPHLHMAILYSANARDDLAIDAYRRALDANARWVLRSPTWVQRLLRAYLRRADSLVARRKKRSALTLLDEIASLDLRLADLDLRLAVTRRRDRLLVDRARRRLAPS